MLISSLVFAYAERRHFATPMQADMRSLPPGSTPPADSGNAPQVATRYACLLMMFRSSAFPEVAGLLRCRSAHGVPVQS